MKCVAVLALAASACSLSNTRHQREALIGDVAFAAGVGVGAYGVSEETSCDPHLAECWHTPPILVASAMLLLSGVVMWAHVSSLDHRSPEATQEANVLAPGASDAETLQLAQQAQRAAGLGRCYAARMSLTRIEARDPAFHAKLTHTDPIARCL